MGSRDRRGLKGRVERLEAAASLDRCPKCLRLYVPEESLDLSLLSEPELRELAELLGRVPPIECEGCGRPWIDLSGLDALPTEEKLRLAALLFQAAGTKASSIGLRELPGTRLLGGAGTLAGRGTGGRVEGADEDGDPDHGPSGLPLPGIMADVARVRRRRSEARRKALPGFGGIGGGAGTDQGG